MSKSIADKLGEMLRDETSFDTRAGLRFMVELLQDAFEYIETEKKAHLVADETLRSFSTRIKNVEDGLFQFLENRKKEQERADDERKFYRRAVIGGIIAIVVSEIMRWIFTFGGKLP